MCLLLNLSSFTFHFVITLSYSYYLVTALRIITDLRQGVHWLFLLKFLNICRFIEMLLNKKLLIIDQSHSQKLFNLKKRLNSDRFKDRKVYLLPETKVKSWN